MFDVIVQAAGLILCGVFWRAFAPLGLEADGLRRHLTGLVYALLLPALVLSVLWRAPMGADTLRIAAVAAVGVTSGLALAWLWFRRVRVSRAGMGAMLLAAAFPNATYMGLPVLEAALGPWARSVAIQYDLFACTPLLLSIGMYVAAHYGTSGERVHPILSLLRVPPLWAAIAAVALNAGQVPQPAILGGALDMLGGAVVPLMLFSLGLGLQWSGGWWSRLSTVAPVVVIQLALVPLIAWGAAIGLGLSGDLRVAVVLEAAMPSMVLGIVICDRFGLDTASYAMAVTLTTALSLITLPAWFELP
ncbi:MAG: AEC family transporter [Thiohalomonadaceae bacterium]